MRFIFQTILTLTLFSLWAGFALLVINPFFHTDLPLYTIGKLCIWELVSLIFAAVIAQLMIKRWGIPRYEMRDQNVFVMNQKYAVYFLVYFLIALLVAIWQFWIFSQNY